VRMRLPLSATLFPYTTLFRSWFCTVCSELGAGRTISRLPSRGCRRIPGAALLVPSCRRTVLYCLATPLSGVGVVAAPPCEGANRSEEHTSELQSRFDLVCRLL